MLSLRFFEINGLHNSMPCIKNRTFPQVTDSFMFPSISWPLIEAKYANRVYGVVHPSRNWTITPLILLLTGMSPWNHHVPNMTMIGYQKSPHWDIMGYNHWNSAIQSPISCFFLIRGIYIYRGKFNWCECNHVMSQQYIIMGNPYKWRFLARKIIELILEISQKTTFEDTGG